MRSSRSHADGRAAAERAHPDPVSPADAEINLDLRRSPSGRAPPSLQRFRFRPRAEDFFTRRREPALEPDRDTGGLACGGSDEASFVSR